MGLSYLLQVSLHFQTPLFDLGGLGSNPACSHRIPPHRGWPRTSERSQGNSSAGLEVSPEDVCERLELWHVPCHNLDLVTCQQEQKPMGKGSEAGRKG